MVSKFQEANNTKETIGFSNARMSYDDVFSKLLFFLERRSFAVKATESAISDRFKLKRPFTEDVLEQAVDASEGFSAARRLNVVAQANDEYEVVHVDTSSMVSANQDLFCRFPNLQDALNGSPAYEADHDDLETLQFLTMVRYERVKVFTVDHQGRDIPFVEVESDGVAYDSRTMGLGELAAFHLWWALKSLNERTILLLEEPESYLSPGCQTAFAGILAKCSDEGLRCGHDTLARDHP